MRRIGIGLAAGVAIWVGSAMAAEAQTIQIQPIGPTAMYTSSSNTTYQAMLTPGLALPIDVQLKVYVNQETTPRYTSNILFLNITGTYGYSKKCSLAGWNLHSGDVVRFHLECWWDPTGQMTSNDYSVTVTGS